MLLALWLVMPMSPRRYQPPKSAGGAGGAYMGGGAAIGMSAANAIDEISDAAPAARRDLTLRIGFVLMAGEAKCRCLTFWKLTGGTIAPNV